MFFSCKMTKGQLVSRKTPNEKTVTDIKDSKFCLGRNVRKCGKKEVKDKHKETEKAMGEKNLKQLKCCTETVKKIQSSHTAMDTRSARREKRSTGKMSNEETGCQRH